MRTGRAISYISQRLKSLSVISAACIVSTLRLAPVKSPRPVVCAQRRSLTVGGRQRTFITVRGPAATARPASLVLVLHGTLQTARSIRRFAGFSFDRFAADGKAVVVYPDALRRDWNGARKAVMMSKKTKTVDDVGFIRALIAHMVADEADAQRVYAIGFSLGGQMVIRLIHEIPELLAGAAIIGSNQPAPDNFTISYDAPAQLPVMTMHGTADPLAPFDGGQVSVHGYLRRGEHLSAPATAAYFAARNGVTTPPTASQLPNIGDFGKPSRVTRYDYTADGAAPVRFYAIDGGGHVVPNPRRQPPKWLLGPRTGHLVAADTIAEFFGLSGDPVSQQPTNQVHRTGWSWLFRSTWAWRRAVDGRVAGLRGG
jgi:polyhydroxybutyrate depolymerase